MANARRWVLIGKTGRRRNGAFCRCIDGAAGDVSFTADSWTKPESAEVCPAAITKNSFELQWIDVTDESKQVTAGA